MFPNTAGNHGIYLITVWCIHLSQKYFNNNSFIFFYQSSIFFCLPNTHNNNNNHDYYLTNLTSSLIFAVITVWCIASTHLSEKYFYNNSFI